MRAARNFGYIGIAAAMMLCLVIVALAGVKLRTKSRSRQSILTTSPELGPTYQPTLLPTIMPSSSSAPSFHPSEVPSSLPSAHPTLSTSPSSQPSLRPSISAVPSTQPSSIPSLSAMPSNSPSFIPSAIPSANPSSAPSEFFGSNTTIVLDGGHASAVVSVGLIFLIAFSYAAMYMCRKENQSNDHCVGSNLFNNIFQNNGFQNENDPASDKSEIISNNSLSRQKSDDTIDTNHVYPMNCTKNGINTRVKEMDIELPDCMSPMPPRSNRHFVSEADTNTKDIDVEDGKCGVLPSSVAVSKHFKISGISPLKTPKVFKKRHQSKLRDEKLDTRKIRDRNSSVYARGDTPWRRISRHSLADDMMDESDHITHVESPVSFYATAKKGRLSSDKLYSKESSKQGNPKETLNDEDHIESLAYASLKEQKKCKINVYDSHKDRALRRAETTTIKSDGSSTIEWDGDIASPSLQRPSFDDNLKEFDDIMVEMETYGIEVSARYDSDDID
jgi:hypothetical protein